MAKQLTDEDIRAITDTEMRNSVGYSSGKLAAMRQKALWYYFGTAKGDLAPPEIEGRSSVVVPVVRNIVESMLPQLMVKFSGSDTVVEFEATKPGDEAVAEQATDYINYLFYQKNDGERIAYQCIKDALMSKKGFCKVWWDESDTEKREEYRGLSDVELAQIMDDEEVKITEQKSYPDEEDTEQRQKALEQLQGQLQQATQAAQQGDPKAQQDVQGMTQQMQSIQSQPPKMLFDVVAIRTTKGGRICVDPLPPEEFLISRDAKSIEDARFCAHRVLRTRSDLVSSGYKNVDQISGDDQGFGLNMERVERLAWDDETAYSGNSMAESADDSQRSVWVTECYIRVDADGDGISELRKVVRAGNQVLENEVCDVAPFVDFDCVPIPHKFFGLSVADLAMEGQRVETSLLRATLDNTYLQTNGRYFAVEGQVNLDDLLTSRPGGVVRIKQSGAVGPLDQGRGDLGNAMQMLEYTKGFVEDSTGWTRYNQGSDGDSLNQTATGVNQIVNRADMRLDLIARNLATGFRKLFELMLKLVSQYQQKEQIVKLRGTWVPVDPRLWTNGFGVCINVGLGTGDKTQRVQQLMALLNEQKQGMQFGIATPGNVFEAEKELVKALGFKSADKFWTDPSKIPPPQPPQDPEMVKAQSAMQLQQAKAQSDMQIAQMQSQMKAQADAQAKQLDYQMEQQRIQMQMQLESNKQEMQARDSQLTNQIEAQRDVQKAQMEAQLQVQRMEFEKWKAELDARVKLRIATIGNEASADEVLLEQGPIGGLESPSPINQLAQMHAQTMAVVQQLANAVSKPKQIIRDANGRAQGVA